MIQCFHSLLQNSKEKANNTEVGAASNNIIINHDFSGGLHSWNPNNCKAIVVSSDSYVIVTDRTKSWQGLEQDITSRVSVGSFYSVSAYVSLSGAIHDATYVQGTLKLEYRNSNNEYVFIGRKSVVNRKWEKVKGSFSLLTMPDRVVFYLEGPPPGADLLIKPVIISSSTFVDHNNSKVGAASNNIIINHDFSGGLHSWYPNCCKAIVVSSDKYVIVTNRTKNWSGLEQDITNRVSVGSSYGYSVSAYVSISGAIHDAAYVQGTLKLEYKKSDTQFVFIGRKSVVKGNWEKLEGSFSLSAMPDRVIFYLEGPPPGADLLIKSVVVSSSTLNDHLYKLQQDISVLKKRVDDIVVLEKNG